MSRRIDDLLDGERFDGRDPHMSENRPNVVSEISRVPRDGRRFDATLARFKLAIGEIVERHAL